MVANTMIAAIAKHGKTQDDEVNVYHVASTNSNPITIFHTFEYLYECFHEAPLTERAHIARLRFFDNFPEFLEYTREQIFQCSGGDAKMIRQCNAKVEYAQKLCKTYEFAAFCKARYVYISTYYCCFSCWCLHTYSKSEMKVTCPIYKVVY